jgi:GntR family transcriptional regulator
MVQRMPFQFRLDPATGVPAYRQIIDQVLAAVAAGGLKGGDQLPTVRQLAVDLSINPNTVIRAYRELEIRGVLTTQQGIGTFVSKEAPTEADEAARQARLSRLAADCAARAGADGFTLRELMVRLEELAADSPAPSARARS